MGESTGLKFCGQSVSTADLALIGEIVKDCDGLSRNELAFTVCELLDWRRPNGGLKHLECRQFLEELQEAGLLNLPGKKTQVRKPKPLVVPEEPSESMPPLIEGKLADLGPLDLEIVETPEARKVWKDWVNRYHYLGCKVPFGAQLRYFVCTTRPTRQRVGCIQLSSPAWRMAPRDHWIGWDDEQRVRKLQSIVQNSRFMLVPWVKIPHLASAALACMAKKLPPHWEARYAVQPLLLETLVDGARFQGTCYRAANWIHVGQTTGRGRMNKSLKDVGPPKEVWLYPLCRKAREKLLEP